MQPAPLPMFKGDPNVVQVDPLSQAVHDGVKANVLAGDLRVLEQQVHQLERTLPAAAPRRPAVPKSRQKASAPWHTHTASGARHNATDRESIQTAHDAICALAAAAREGSAADGNVNPSEQSAFRSARFGG